MLANAHNPYKSLLDNTLAILTLYLSPYVLGSHYERVSPARRSPHWCGANPLVVTTQEMKKFDQVLERANRDTYNPAGLNILSPRRTAFLFVSWALSGSTTTAHILRPD